MENAMTIQEFINAFPNLNDYFYDKPPDELLKHETKIQEFTKCDKGRIRKRCSIG